MVYNRDKWFKHEIKEVTFYILFGTFTTIILTLFIGLVLGAFEESFVAGRPLQFGDLLTTYMVYYIFILAGLIGLPALKIREMFITKRGEHPANQSKPTLFSVAYLHDPETDGALWHLFESLGLKGNKNPMRWSLSIFRCFVYGTIIFGALGIFQMVSQTAFTSIPQLPFQITPFSEAYFTAEPASFGETTLMILVFSLMMGLVAWFSSKLELGKTGYYLIGIFIVCTLIGIGWMGLHNIVYGESEAKLFTTFIFGSVGAFITLITGTFVFWYIWHFWNNIFVKLGEIATIQEDVVFFAIIAWVILLALTIGIELLIRRYRKKRQEKILVPT